MGTVNGVLSLRGQCIFECMLDETAFTPAAERIELPELFEEAVRTRVRTAISSKPAVESRAQRRGIPALTEQHGLEGLNLKAHSTGLTKKTADVIGSKLRKVGLVTFVRPSKVGADKYDVLVKVEH